MTFLKYYASLQFLPSCLAWRWWIVLAILALTVLFGRRIYCGFICPLGLAQSLVRASRGQRRVCSRLDRALLRPKDRKGTVLLAIRLTVLLVFLAVGLVGLGWQWLDPYSIAARAVCCFTAEDPEWPLIVFATVPAAIVLLLAIFAGGLRFGPPGGRPLPNGGGRIWCNLICPVGTILSFVGCHPVKGDKVSKCAGCDSCRKCFEKR